MTNAELTIKAILDRKPTLESNIAAANRILNHANLSTNVGIWTKNRDRIDVVIENEFLFNAIHLQLEQDEKELAEINKKLDAIHALMTM